MTDASPREARPVDPLDPFRMREATAAFTELLADLPRLGQEREAVRPLMGATPATVVYREHTLTLRRYASSGVRHETPVLLVPSLVNGSCILDLLPGESLVEHLVAQGHDVFLLDWGLPNAGQRRLPLDFYVDHYLDRVVRRVTRIAGRPETHLVGYCLGGTLSTLYLASRDEAPVASFVAMTTPIGFVDGGMLSWWSRPEHIDVDRLVDTFGNIPDTFFRSVFPWIVPVAPLRKMRTLVQRRDDAEFLRSFLALDIWITENVPFPGEVYRQVIKDLYQANRLLEGSMRIGGRPAPLSRIQQPVLAMVARSDHVAPAGSCEPLVEQVSSRVRKLEVFETGHLGPALGRDARGQQTTAYWQVLDAWLQRGWKGAAAQDAGTSHRGSSSRGRSGAGGRGGSGDSRASGGSSAGDTSHGGKATRPGSRIARGNEGRASPGRSPARLPSGRAP